MICYFKDIDRTLIIDGDVVVMSGSPEVIAARHAQTGKRYGYPSCCIEAFVQDVSRGILPASHRPSAPAPSGEGSYVVCAVCEAHMASQRVL